MNTPRLGLRALCVDDAPAVFAYARDPEVARFTLWEPHASEEATRSFLTGLTGPFAMAWAIIPDESRAFAGMVFLHSLNAHHRKAELAFNLGRQSWNQGIATEAAAAVLGFAFGKLGLNRVEATCMPGNAGSRRVLEKLGMSQEGTMRSSHWRHDGFHDMVLFSVLRGERPSA